MALPVDPVDRPAVLTGKSNGQLPDAILAATPGEGDGPTIRLVTPATRSWRALCAAAAMTLAATSAADSYRPYAVQEAVFRDRYTKTRPLYVDPSDYVTWQGAHWYKRPGEATAAVPGTSNHGWGLAVDVANASGDRLSWLLANARRFGWSWELQSEPWHIRYTKGDAIPPAVLAYESGDDDVNLDDRVDLPALTGVKWGEHPMDQGVPDGQTVANALSKAMGYGIQTRGLVQQVQKDMASLRAELLAAIAAIPAAGGASAPSAAEIAEAVLDEQHRRTES